MEVKETRIGAYGIIIQDKKIALVLKKGGAYSGRLDLPGGKIEHGETIEEGLKRELIEEIGVNIKSYNLLDVYSVNVKWNIKNDLIENLHHIGILYEVSIFEKNIKKEPDLHDSNGSDWYLISNLNKNNLTPFALYSLEKLGYNLKED